MSPVRVSLSGSVNVDDDSKPEIAPLVNRRFTGYIHAMSEKSKNQQAYDDLVRKYGKAEIARWAGLSRQALSKWDKIGAVPATRVQAISAASGLPPEVIRPEPYAVP